ncbi:MAG TPA: hypothetical protein VKK61_09190 [Tepidisphaeraceae bacterium]|nr:hypothetical protein [Tepidisphaeraceae bacterium]
MPSQNRPASKEQAPDPATSYERAKPEKESATGRLDSDKPVPADRPDSHNQAGQKRRPSQQINAQQDINKRASSDPNR